MSFHLFHYNEALFFTILFHCIASFLSSCYLLFLQFFFYTKDLLQSAVNPEIYFWTPPTRLWSLTANIAFPNPTLKPCAAPPALDSTPPSFISSLYLYLVPQYLACLNKGPQEESRVPAPVPVPREPPRY